MYFAEIDGTGAALGFLEDDSGVTPDNCVALTDAQYAQWSASPASFIWHGGTLAENPAAATAATVIANIQAECAAKSALGVYYQPAGATAPVLFWTDPASIVKLEGVSEAVTQGLVPNAGQPFVGCTPSPVTMLPADIQALFPKVFAYVAACTANAAALETQVNAGNLAVDITAGWPANT